MLKYNKLLSELDEVFIFKDIEKIKEAFETTRNVLENFEYYEQGMLVQILCINMGIKNSLEKCAEIENRIIKKL